jgi:AcrR family transcriptional regulator
MSSTLRADAERNRRLIVEAAAQAFAEEGFDVGVAEIARRAGVGNATVFRRFPTKDALFDAVIEARIAELDAVAAAALEVEDPWAALVQFLEQAAAMQARDRGLYQATEQLLLKHPEILEKHRCVVDRVEPLVRRAQDAGVLRADVTTTDVLGLMKAAVAAVPPLPGVREDGWRRPMGIIVDGLRAEAASELPIPSLDFDEIAGALHDHAA